MKLLVRELINELAQPITATENADIVAVRPHLFIVNNPAGNLKVQLQDSGGFVIDESNTVDISTISSAVAFHGGYKFDLVSPVLKDESYRLALIPGGGYTFSHTSYVGWVNDYDLRRYSATYSPSSGDKAPLNYEFWKKRGFDVVRELDFADGFESSQEPTSDVTEISLLNNTTDQVLTGFLFDPADFHGVEIFYRAHRQTDDSEHTRSGWLKLAYSPDNLLWETPPGHEVTEQRGDVGITFKMNGNQLEADTTDITGANYKGGIQLHVVVRYPNTTII